MNQSIWFWLKMIFQVIGRVAKRASKNELWLKMQEMIDSTCSKLILFNDRKSTNSRIITSKHKVVFDNFALKFGFQDTNSFFIDSQWYLKRFWSFKPQNTEVYLCDALYSLLSFCVFSCHFDRYMVNEKGRYHSELDRPNAPKGFDALG